MASQASELDVTRGYGRQAARLPAPINILLVDDMRIMLARINRLVMAALA